MELIPEDIIKLALAIVAGGIIGAEREFRDKAAGFRTIIFIAFGSALFTMISIKLGSETNTTRIAANIVTGIGFLGAGAIMRDGTRVAGLTTAATIWLAAALGMSIGGGHYILALAATMFAIVVLWLFPGFERWLDNIRETRTYEISIPLDAKIVEKLPEVFAKHAIHIRGQAEHKRGPNIQMFISTTGRPTNHKKLVKHLISEADILELKY